MIETENSADTGILRREFPLMREADMGRVSFSEDNYSASDVMRFIEDRKIPIIKMERLEPGLEELFVEVSVK